MMPSRTAASTSSYHLGVAILIRGNVDPKISLAHCASVAHLRLAYENQQEVVGCTGQPPLPSGVAGRS